MTTLSNDEMKQLESLPNELKAKLLLNMKKSDNEKNRCPIAVEKDRKTILSFMEKHPNELIYLYRDIVNDTFKVYHQCTSAIKENNVCSRHKNVDKFMKINIINGSNNVRILKNNKDDFFTMPIQRGRKINENSTLNFIISDDLKDTFKDYVDETISDKSDSTDECEMESKNTNIFEEMMKEKSEMNIKNDSDDEGNNVDVKEIETKSGHVFLVEPKTLTVYEPQEDADAETPEIGHLKKVDFESSIEYNDEYYIIPEEIKCNDKVYFKCIDSNILCDSQFQKIGLIQDDSDTIKVNISTDDGRQLLIDINDMKAIDKESDEIIGTLMKTNIKTSISFDNNNYIIGIPIDHQDKTLYRSGLSDDLFEEIDDVCHKVGKVKCQKNGEYKVFITGKSKTKASKK